MAYAPAMVYKDYKPDAAAVLNVVALESMPEYLESLPFAQGMELLSRAAWPCRLVEGTAGSVTGFVMPAIPPEFFIDMTKASGVDRVTAEFQHLLNDASFLARRGISLTDRNRYELLSATAEALSILHRHHISVGDLSPKNLLFALAPHPRVYFIDCDAMVLQGRSVATQLETPGWDVHGVHPRETLATAATDHYKLGLLALRLLVGDQTTRDPARLPATVPAPVRALVQAAVNPDAAARPTPDTWLGPLTAAARTASTALPQRVIAQPAAARAAPMSLPQRIITQPATAPRPVPVLSAPSAPTNFSGAATSASRSTSMAASATPQPNRRRTAIAIGAAAIVITVSAVVLGHLTSSEKTPTVAVGNYPRAVAADASSQSVYVTNQEDGTISVIDTTSRKILDTIQVGGHPHGITIDSGSHTAYVADYNGGTVLVIDTTTRRVTGTISVGGSPDGVAVDPGTHTAYVADYNGGTVLVIDTITRSVTDTIPLGGVPSGTGGTSDGVAVDPGTQAVYVINASADTVLVIDTATHQVIDTIPVGGVPAGVAVDVDNHTAYITTSGDTKVSVIDTTSRRVIDTVPVGGNSQGVAVDPGTHTAYVAVYSTIKSTVSLIDTTTRKVTDTVPAGRSARGMAVDLANHTAYVVNADDNNVSIIGTH